MSRYKKANSIKSVGIVGTGTIGASWTSYFLAKGFKVKAWDPGDNWGVKLGEFIDNAWPDLEKLGLSDEASQSNLSLCNGLGEVAKEVDFIQESAPERLDVKQDLFKVLDKITPASVIISSSTSGLIMSEMQSNLTTTARFVFGHHFNPPHFIPVYEVVG